MTMSLLIMTSHILLSLFLSLDHAALQITFLQSLLTCRAVAIPTHCLDATSLEEDNCTMYDGIGVSVGISLDYDESSVDEPLGTTI